jgi:hypothetical protein
LFVFAADEHPPADVTAIQTAFMSAGINITFNTGYRSYYQEMKRTRPAWNGIAPSSSIGNVRERSRTFGGWGRASALGTRGMPRVS